MLSSKPKQGVEDRFDAPDTHLLRRHTAVFGVGYVRHVL